ncbi:hypothetical protein [Pedobacter yonginense]|nr:hypothetical protein [Pedobacter yonginense]
MHTRHSCAREETEQICKDIEENLKKISGYRTGVGKEFTFRVWTQPEYETIVKATAHKLF